MHFSILKEEILKYLQYANNFTSTKNLNDILQNVYISAEDNHINIKTNNHQQFNFICKIGANIIENGETTVSCKKLLDIIKELPDGSLIDFKYNGSRLNINSGKSSFELSTMNPDIFPNDMKVIPEYTLNIDTKTLLTLFKRTVFCVSNDHQNIEYTGSLFNIIGDRLEIFATGHRKVAIAFTKLNQEYANDFGINIPKKTVLELIKILENYETVKIETDRKQISFSSDNITIYSKLIEKYVKNIDKLFLKEYNIKAKIERKSFIEASKRVSTITNSEEIPGISLNFEKTSLTITSLETVYGKGSETIENIEFNQEEPFEIILNSRDVNEIIDNIETEYFTLEMIDKRSLALITPDSDDYRYLVVPISIDKI